MLDARGLGRIQAISEADFLEQGKEIVVAIRPEKLLLATEPATNERYSVKGELKTSAYLGDRSHFYITVKGCDKPLAVASHEVELPNGQSLQRGNEVWLSWAEESLVLLPAS